MVLIFSPAIFWCRRYYSHFFWIISLSQAYLFSLPVLAFVFPLHFPPLGSSTRSPSPALTRPILSALFHSLLTSRPLSLSPLSSRCTLVSSCSSLSYSEGGAGSVWLGWGGRQHLISYLRINHEVLSTQSSSDPSASLSASSRHTHHWLMAVRAPVHSTHQPAFIPQPRWTQNVQHPTTELYSTGL